MLSLWGLHEQPTSHCLFRKLILKKDILLVKFQQKEVLPEFFPKTEQNSSPVNVSIYSDSDVQELAYSSCFREVTQNGKLSIKSLIFPFT